MMLRRSPRGSRYSRRALRSLPVTTGGTASPNPRPVAAITRESSSRKSASW